VEIAAANSARREPQKCIGRRFDSRFRMVSHFHIPNALMAHCFHKKI
jgi:hypothetical protein